MRAPPLPWDLLAAAMAALTPGMVRVRQISANTEALGLGARSIVLRSTAIKPKRFEYPSAHSKLSIAVQYR